MKISMENQNNLTKLYKFKIKELQTISTENFYFKNKYKTKISTFQKWDQTLTKK